MLSHGTPLQCALLRAQKYTPAKQKSGSRKHGLHNVISFWDDLEMTLFLWGKREYGCSQWHTVPIFVLLLLNWLGHAQFPCGLKATTAGKVLQFQDTSPREASSRNKVSAYWKEGLMSRVWFIPANFILWFDALPSHYLQLISKTVVSRVSNDFECWQNITLETKSENLFFNFPIQCTS